MKRWLPWLAAMLVLLCALPVAGMSQKAMLDKAGELKWEVVNKVKAREFDEALKSANEALELTKQAVGAEDRLVAECIAYAGWVYEGQEDYETAADYYQQAVDLFKKTDGTYSANVALYEQRIGLQFRNLERYGEAETHYKAALVAARKAHGPKHPMVSDIHNHLGIMFRGMDDLDKAESHYRKALDVRKRPFAPPDASVAAIKANLAYLEQERGHIDEAQSLHKQALDIRERTVGGSHPDVAASLNDIARIHDEKGQYARALPLYKRAVKIARKQGVRGNATLAEYLGNLGGLYFVLGDWEQAQTLKKEALKLAVTTFGDDHLTSATHANNLAVVYDSTGKHAEAKPLFEWALKVREEQLGKEHAHVGVTLHNLAKTHYSLGNYGEAEPMFQRALAIWTKELGATSREVGVCNRSLAETYDKLGDVQKAEKHFRTSIDTMIEALGPTHQEVGAFQYVFAEYLARQGRFGEAVRSFHQAQLAEMASLRTMSSNISERWLTEYLTTRRHMLVAYLSLVGGMAGNDPVVARQALDIWLARKGIILDARMQFRRKMVASDNYKANRVFKKLSKVRAELSYLGTTGKGADSDRMDRLMAEKNELEDQLAHLSQSFAKGRARTKADVEAVARALPKGSALVDIARIARADFRNMRWLPAHYLAFVLPAGQPDAVQLLDLGSADEIDGLVAQYRDAVLQGADYTPFSRSLFSVVFKPLMPHLGDAKDVFVSPDGVLSFVPMEVLMQDDDSFLVDEYAFNYLTSGRDVMEFHTSSGKPGPSLVLGDPDFNFKNGRGMQRTQVVRLGRAKKNGYVRSADLRGMVFDPLPATRKEAEAVYAMIRKNERKTKLRLGPDAVERALLKAKKPRILHLATHGFFLSDQELQALQEIGTHRGVSIQEKGALPPDAESMQPPAQSLAKASVSYENPLLRTGLALAGANNALAVKDPRESTGIFTAEKVLGMDLEGTELVVLSACETGMGKAKSGEGVYGLRRAFLQAGAKSLVMSMWPVPDKETLELMETFYRNLDEGKNRGQALRNAILTQKKVVAERYGTPNPFYWGAFVFFGDPGATR